jgi:hypothetical protein
VGIQKDAGKVLVFLYKKYSNDELKKYETQFILNELKWTPDRLKRAITYLIDEELIKTLPVYRKAESITLATLNRYVSRLTPKGIRLVENKGEFKKQFGFEVGLLGLFKLSMGAEEK